MTLFAKPGAPVVINSVADWIDDKFYSTVTMDNGGLALKVAPRALPAFGEEPGNLRQEFHRWPDVLNWYANRPNDLGRRHEVLAELRSGERRMTRMLAQTITMGLKIRQRDADAVVDMIALTRFGDTDSEWALANLIDAAVELAADEHERLAQAWADAARERRWSVAAGPPL